MTTAAGLVAAVNRGSPGTRSFWARGRSSYPHPRTQGEDDPQRRGYGQDVLTHTAAWKPSTKTLPDPEVKFEGLDTDAYLIRVKRDTSGVTASDHIHHNWFKDSYSIEFVRTGVEIDHNLFDFDVKADGGNLSSALGNVAAKSPATFHNNLVSNPDRGVIRMNEVFNNPEVRNNHVKCRTRSRRRTSNDFDSRRRRPEREFRSPASYVAFSSTEERSAAAAGGKDVSEVSTPGRGIGQALFRGAEGDVQGEKRAVGFSPYPHPGTRE